MRQVVKGRGFPCHDHVGQQCILGMYMGASFDRRDHRHANVGEILDNLSAFVVNLAPDSRIGDVAERRKIDPRDELSARSRQDHNLVVPILRDAVESLDKVGMILRRKRQGTVVGMELGHQYPLRVPAQFQTTVRCEICAFRRLHSNPPRSRKFHLHC